MPDILSENKYSGYQAYYGDDDPTKYSRQNRQEALPSSQYFWAILHPHSDKQQNYQQSSYTAQANSVYSSVLYAPDSNGGFHHEMHS